MLDYSKVLLKDKGDLTKEVISQFDNINVLGAYENNSHIKKENIRILSVKFSRTGKRTLDQYPNVKWIICRSHGTDNINDYECKKRGIKVIATSPDSEPCSDWLYNKVEDDKVLIFGNGSISKKLQSRLKNYRVVNSKTNYSDIDKWLKHCKTIIIAVSLTNETKGYFNKEFFDKISNRVNIVSISRGEVFDNNALIDAIKEEKICIGEFDILSPHRREELLSYPFIKWYNHTAWKSYEEERYGVKYANQLKEIIDEKLSTIKENIWF